MLSSGCIALAPLAETDKVVLMGLAATAPKLTEQREWVFRFWPLATNEAPPIRMILQELKIRKLGLLYLNDAYGLSALEAVKGEFEKRTEKSFREPLRSARPIIEIKLRN
jgi:ABC-type branched-subunit amino acid transport system substrate-binding protein